MTKRTQESESQKKNTAEIKISQILHQARLRKNYSLEDLYKITKIKPLYLKDVESGQFSKLPGGFYVRAFIQKYADAVGVDGSELLRRYNNKLPDLQDPHYMNSVSEDKLLVNAEKQRIKTRHSTVRKYIPLVSLIIVVMLVLIGIWVVTSHYHNSLTIDSGQHSTTMSGASSSAPVRKHKRHHKSKSRPRITIRRQASDADRLVYRVATHGRLIHMKVMSAKPVQLTVKVGNKTSDPINMKAKQIKRIKIPFKSKQVQLNSNNNSVLKSRINGKLVKFNSKSSVRSITFKLIK